MFKWKQSWQELEVDWCNRAKLETCEAFLDCPFYNPDWFDCDLCRYHEANHVISEYLPEFEE